MRNLPETAPFAAGNEASRQAADGIQHQLEGIRALVFDLIVSRETLGATNSEIAALLDMSRDNTQPRSSELKEAGYILDSGMMRKNANEKNETVWVAAKSYPKGPWKTPKAAPVDDGPSGLKVFDDVFRRNPHLRNTFRVDEIITIRAALQREAELP